MKQTFKNEDLERKKLIKGAILFFIILIFALIGESLIEKFLDYLNNLNP